MNKLTVFVGAASLAAVTSVPASAADASITVPKTAPKTVTASFTGTYPFGANVALWTSNASSCQGNPAPFNDNRKIQVKVPAGAYKAVKAKMTITIDAPWVLAGDFMEVLDPSGNSVGTDGQKKEIEVDVTNPQSGTWTVLTCMFVPDSAGPHNYQGTVTISTKPKGKK